MTEKSKQWSAEQFLGLMWQYNEKFFKKLAGRVCLNQTEIKAHGIKEIKEHNIAVDKKGRVWMQESPAHILD